jgi:hypothetical protein
MPFLGPCAPGSYYIDVSADFAIMLMWDRRFLFKRSLMTASAGREIRIRSSRMLIVIDAMQFLA